MNDSTQSSDARKPDFHWGGRPVYRCRKCPYERVENLAAVLQHEAAAHPIVVVTRESRILDQGGEPVLVAEPSEE